MRQLAENKVAQLAKKVKVNREELRSLLDEKPEFTREELGQSEKGTRSAWRW